MEVLIAQALQHVNNLTPTQRWGIALSSLLVIVSIFVFAYANQAEEIGQKTKELVSELDASPSLLDPANINDGSIGQTETYEWSQGDSEIEVFINLTRYSTEKLRGKDIQVEIKSRSLKVKILNELVVDGELESTVLVEDSTWLIDEISAKHLVIKDSSGSNASQFSQAYANPLQRKDQQQVLWITLMKAKPSDKLWPGLLKGEKNMK